MTQSVEDQLSMDDLIHQSVIIGSVYLAMQSSAFTEKQLLEWLSKYELVFELTQVAYKAVCQKIHPNDQYLSDGSHFLCKQPDYAPFAIKYGLNRYIPDKLNQSGEKRVVLEHITKSINDFMTKNDDGKLMKLIIDGEGYMTYVYDKLILCYLARNFPYVKLKAEQINESLIDADWVEKFRYKDNLISNVLNRVKFLEKHAPLYYKIVAHQHYVKVVQKIQQDKLFSKLNKTDIQNIDKIFPGIIDSKVFEYNDLGLKLSLMSPELSGYLLGYPIQEIIPNELQIHMAIMKLMELGIEGYTKCIAEWVHNTYLVSIPFDSNIIKYANDENVIMDKIDIYSPFDIIVYQTGNYTYRFTRCEFDKICESKNNPWTNMELPISVVLGIQARSIAANKLKLPPSRPLQDMLERVEKGTLYKTDQEENKGPSNQGASSNQIIESFINTILNGGGDDVSVSGGIITNSRGDGNMSSLIGRGMLLSMLTSGSTRQSGSGENYISQIFGLTSGEPELDTEDVE